MVKLLFVIVIVTWSATVTASIDVNVARAETLEQIERCRENTKVFIEDADVRVTIFQEGIDHTNGTYDKAARDSVHASIDTLSVLKVSLLATAELEGKSEAIECINKKFNKYRDDLNEYLDNYNSDVIKELDKTSTIIETGRTKINSQRVAIDYVFDDVIIQLSTCQDVVCIERMRNEAITRSENSRKSLSDAINEVETSRVDYNDTVPDEYDSLTSHVTSTESKGVKAMKKCL